MARELVFSVTIKDCTVQTFRSGGNGGQNKDKRDTGVRIIHNASGARGESTEHRTQGQNKKTAFKRMAESFAFKQWIQEQLRQDDVPPSANPERIRTYNLIDRRVTDHRIKYTVHDVQAVLDGDLDEIQQALHCAIYEVEHQ